MRRVVTRFPAKVILLSEHHSSTDASKLPTFSADGYMQWSSAWRQAVDNSELAVLADMLDKEASRED